jgi:oligopeptide transport system permease protein
VTRFVLRRVAWLAVTLWLVFTVTFFLMRAVPGGPLKAERAVDPVIQRHLEARYHLDEPRLQQYFRELGNVVRGDLGHSFRLKDFSVNEIIAQGFPITAALGLAALVLAVLLGLPAGIVAAARRGTPLDSGVMAAATLGIAVPNFVVASLAIIALVFVLPMFPAAGWGTPRHLVLPALCLSLPYAAYVARLTRTGLLEVLAQDHIRTARAKGVSPAGVVLRHALREALLPLVSFLGPATAGLLTGSLVIEQMFAIPGLGMHFVQAAEQRDYTLAMGLVLLYTLLLCSMNVAVDVAYGILDPRVRIEE